MSDIFDLKLTNTTMANKRTLKRTINAMCGELFAECVAIRHFQNTNPADVDNIMMAILLMQDDMICRISHPEPGMPTKDFFKKLKQDLESRTGDIVAMIENAI